MPELPEVETVRRGLEPVMEGAVITRVEQRRADLRFPFPVRFEARLTGRRVVSLGRRAKYLLADLDDGTVLVMHLGMSGSFRVFNDVEGRFHHARSKDPRHDHVAFHLSNGAEVVYNDPRRFGFMDLVPRSDLARCKHFKEMGIEPTGNALSAKVLADLFRDKHAPLKAALLDQHLIAGLGNIYVCEALWRAGLAPTREAGTLARRGMARKAEKLATAIREVLDAAIAAGGSSLRDHRQADGELGYFQHHFKVYDREGEPCPRPGCDGTISRIVQSGRSTFYCPTCQT